MTLSQRLCTDA